MAEKYDEEYWYFITKLKDSFSQNRNDRTVNLTAFDKLKPEKRKLIEDMPLEELKKIAAKVSADVVDIDYLTQDERLLLGEIREGRKLKYKQVVCRLTGKIQMKQIMDGYAKMMQEQQLFRTAYLHKGLENPVKVVYANADRVFPIHDLRNLNRDKQVFVMKNVLASQARHDFNIEIDPVLRIQGYLTGQREILVMISIYPCLTYSVGIRGMLYRIFGGMDAENATMPGVDEESLRQMNEELAEKSIAYWKDLLLPLPESMAIPGEERQTGALSKSYREKTCLYKELNEELVKCLTAFCEKNAVSLKAVFLYAWAELLGKSHDEEQPVLLVTQNGERMNLFPIKVARGEGAHERLKVIDRQLEQSLKFSSCTIHDIESAAGISFPEYFRMVHNFMEFKELDDIESGRSNVRAIGGMNADDIAVNLCVNYHLFEHNIGINYIAKEGFIEIIFDHLHDLFVDELSTILSIDQIRFDKKSFIKVDDTDEEKLEKIKLAQAGLYLKASGIFEGLTVEEIMILAKYCRLSSYLSGDVVLQEKSRNSQIYIVGEGNLEESRTTGDGMVKSLRIIKEGSVFGIESLFPEGKAPTSYTAVSSQVKIVEINKDVLSEVFRRKPEGWLALLQKENDQKCKLQRLWTME